MLKKNSRSNSRKVSLSGKISSISNGCPLSKKGATEETPVFEIAQDKFEITVSQSRELSKKRQRNLSSH